MVCAGVRGAEVPRGGVPSRHELRGQVPQCVPYPEESTAAARNGLPPAQLETQAAASAGHQRSSHLHRQQHLRG
jgi:hypothetical protein